MNVEDAAAAGLARSIAAWLRRLAWPLLIAMACVAGMYLSLALIILPGSKGWGYDFEAYVNAARRLASSGSLYQDVTLSGAFRPGPYGLYLYAPPLGVAVLPLSGVPLPVATALWFALRAGLLGVGCALMPVRPAIRVAIFVSGAFSAVVVADLVLGNVSLLIMVLAVVMWRWLDRPLGAIALAVTMSMRPIFAIFLVWSLLRRRVRWVAWAVIAGVVLVAATLPFVGFRGYEEYLRVVRNVSDVTGVEANLDLGSTMLRLGLSQTVATTALFSGFAVAIVAMLVSLRRDPETGFMVWLGATMLLAPLLWDHYLTLVMLPAAFLAARGRLLWLALPLLTWLPDPLLPVVAIVATVAPLLAPATGAPRGIIRGRLVQGVR